MIIWGINALNHDSSICVFNKEVLFHKRSSESLYLTEDLVKEAKRYGLPDAIAWYERPWIKKTRQIKAGQFKEAFSIKNLPIKYLENFDLHHYPIFYIPHHKSHASYGAYSSKFNNCSILVVDAIGEWNTVSVWTSEYDHLTLRYTKNYPYSLGLFYSAFTELIGLTPVKDESKLTTLSQSGNSTIYYQRVRKYLDKNLHKGIWDWDIDTTNLETTSNIAAAVQKIFEEEILNFANIAKKYSNNLVFTGGCAYNRIVHDKLKLMFEDFHVPDLPGDSGSSIGAAFYLSKKI